MPDQQPISINEQENDWDGLQRTLNYMFKDVYSILDKIQGRNNATFEPTAITLPGGSIIDHNHTEATQGGDYPWGDITEGNVTLLQALSQVVAGADAVAAAAVSAVALTAGADTVDIAACDATLVTLVAEINAIKDKVNDIKDVVNNIWDKLQDSGIAT